MKITFGLVVYNEQDLIRRCMDSIAGIADEIIVVHDGECADQTLSIVREYTDKVFIRQRREGSDPHRIFILEQARNSWVFMIDADEFLSEGLKKFLMHATLEPVFGAYAFKWPLWNGERYVTTTNYRACLFNKQKIWAIGLHNFSIQTVASIQKIGEILEHQPKQNKVSFGRFSGQFQKRIDRDARCFLEGFEHLPKFNEGLIPQEFKDWYGKYVRHAGFYAFTRFFLYFFGTLKNNWRDGYFGLVVSLQAAMYQFKLARRINELKK